MLKALQKFIFMFLIISAAAALTGYVTYRSTSKALRAEYQTATARAAQGDERRQAAKPAEAAKSVSSAPLKIESYLVRLEGSTLSVYANRSNKEEFLYNEEIYVNDLSPTDREMLENGVCLKSASELTGFMENFTS